MEYKLWSHPAPRVTHFIYSSFFSYPYHRKSVRNLASQPAKQEVCFGVCVIQAASALWKIVLPILSQEKANRKVRGVEGGRCYQNESFLSDIGSSPLLSTSGNVSHFMFWKCRFFFTEIPRLFFPSVAFKTRPALSQVWWRHNETKSKAVSFQEKRQAMGE